MEKATRLFRSFEAAEAAEVVGIARCHRSSGSRWCWNSGRGFIRMRLGKNLREFVELLNVNRFVMAKSTNSSRNVVPREGREASDVKAGEKMAVAPSGNGVVLLRRPKSWAKALHGLEKNFDSGTYLDRERSSWERRTPFEGC